MQIVLVLFTKVLRYSADEQNQIFSFGIFSNVKKQCPGNFSFSTEGIVPLISKGFFGVDNLLLLL